MVAARLLIHLYLGAVCLLGLSAVGTAQVVNSTPNTPAAASDHLAVDIPSPEVEREILGLIDHLGHPEYRERELAEKRLREKGFLAIEPLTEASDHEDIEIRIRVRNLVADLRNRLIQESVPAVFRAMLQDYDKKDEASRLEVLRQLSLWPDQSKISVLATLARFEQSELLAKQAALGLMQTDLAEADSLDEQRRAIMAAIGFNRRPAVRWIRAYLLSYESIDAAIAEFSNLMEQENVTYRTTNGKTNPEVLDRLQKFRIDLLLRAGYEDRAREEMKSLAIDDMPRSAWLLVEWLMERSAWGAVEDLSIRYKDRFEKDAMLLYRVAESVRNDGRLEQAEEFAKQAFAAEGAGLSQLQTGLFNRLTAVRDEDDIVRQQRYAIASFLENERGLFDWAEREYRAALPEDPRSPLFEDISTDFALLLHDLQRDGEAGDLMKRLVDEYTKVTADSKEPDEPLNIQASTMYFYYGLDAGMQGDREKQMEYFLKGLDRYRRNADLLIAMYRVEDSTDEFRKITRTAIEEVTAEVMQEIDALRKQLQVTRVMGRRTNVDGMLANLENEYAWLVGNTFGDIDEAIRCSEHSLTVQRDAPGLLDTLARCYYRKGEFETAVKLQRQAAEGAPHELQIQRQLKLIESALANQRQPDGKDRESLESNIEAPRGQGEQESAGRRLEQTPDLPRRLEPDAALDDDAESF